VTTPGDDVRSLPFPLEVSQSALPELTDEKLTDSAVYLRSSDEDVAELVNAARDSVSGLEKVIQGHYKDT